MRCRCYLLLVCCLAVPFTAWADGIDLPLVIGYGVVIFLPILVFNATVETPVIGRLLGVRYAELWPSWFKANLWSLLAGIPALFLNEALTGWFLPVELGKRVRLYPFFLVVFIFVFYVATCTVEYLYAWKLARKAGAQIGRGAMLKAVLLANVASYAVLGPVYFFVERPTNSLSDLRSDARWAEGRKLTVLTVGLNGHLEAATLDGTNHRTIVPHEVRDYVVSEDLGQVLYRGAGDRLFLYLHQTNQPLPEVGFWCRAPEMDFSPTGRYAAFIKWDTHQLRVFDSRVGVFRDVPTFGEGTFCCLAWSSKEEILYVKAGNEHWEVVLSPDVAYRRLYGPPEDFASHYGRVGTTWSRYGVRYTQDQDGPLRLMVWPGWGPHLVVYNQKTLLMRLRDPAGQLGVQEAVFLPGTGEIMAGLGDYVYVLDPAAKRIGPVMPGRDFIALAKPFAKKADFFR